MTSEWFVSCLMGFFKMSCSPYFCMYAELLEVTLNSYPSSQGPWTILYWRKYYASVQDKLVCHTNCLPSRFKWCFQGGTFTLFSFLREKKKNCLFSWWEYLENLSLVLLDCQLKSEMAILFLLVHPVLNVVALRSMLFSMFEFLRVLNWSFNFKKTVCNTL